MYNKMKHISILGASLLGMLMLATSCNDEWKDEQYKNNYISFRAPLGENGVTEIYVPYTRNLYDEDGNFLSTKYEGEEDGGIGWSDYDLPVIVSGSTHNKTNYDVHYAADPDTLNQLNKERFQLRTDLYYSDMTPYATYPEHQVIESGTDVDLLNIKFHLKGIDLVNKWVLPIQIKDSEDYNYISHPRKNYAKAMLRVLPFNDWSGDFSGTGLKIAIKGDEANASSVESVRFYVVDENTVFFYPGTIDEDRKDRKYYKIYASFDGNKSNGVLNLHCDNPSVNFEVNKQASYRVIEEPDAVKDYLIHRYLIINNLSYSFTDYTSLQGYETNYSAEGSLTQERLINSQEPDPQHAIQW